MINRYWAETDGVYELHFEKFGTDEVILKFVQAEDDDKSYLEDKISYYEDLLEQWNKN